MINCPEIPEANYPKAYPIKSLLDNWNTDDTNIPSMHYDSICKFDFNTEYNKAMNYRRAERPFIVYNVPEVNDVVEKWKDPNYLEEKLGKDTAYKSSSSIDNHFMYFKKPKKPKNFADLRDPNKKWTNPTGNIELTYREWLQNALTSHNKSLQDRIHYYFRITAIQEPHWVFKELPFFQPKKSLFMVEPDEQRGIHCRFGMKSVIAESHWDGSRNYAASLGGLRRWILNSPSQCKHTYMFKKGHPAARHSEVDWSKPDYERFPDFVHLQANEVIVRPGDVLYLPTYWFHYIISLNINYQCNTRSGKTSEFDKIIRECGPF